VVRTGSALLGTVCLTSRAAQKILKPAQDEDEHQYVHPVNTINLTKTTTNDIQSMQMNCDTGENAGQVALYCMSDIACHPQHNVDLPKTNTTTSTQEYDDNVVKETHANRNL
jgi:hypothetical protein